MWAADKFASCNINFWFSASLKKQTETIYKTGKLLTVLNGTKLNE